MQDIFRYVRYTNETLQYKRQSLEELSHLIQSRLRYLQVNTNISFKLRIFVILIFGQHKSLLDVNHDACQTCTVWSNSVQRHHLDPIG
mgnify:CR=1 FL=1